MNVDETTNIMMVDHSTTSTDNSRRCDTNHHDIPSSSLSLPPPTTTTTMMMNQNHVKDAVTIDRTKNTVNHEIDDTHCHTKCHVSVRPMNHVLEHPSFPTTDHPIKSSSSIGGSIGGSNTVGTTTTTHIGNHSLCHSHPHHHHDKNDCCNDENKDIETVVSVTIQKLHSVLDRIIQQDMIDPMMEQYHISKQQQMLEEEDEWNNNHIMKPSDPNQSNAFLVRRWIFAFFLFFSSRFDIL